LVDYVGKLAPRVDGSKLDFAFIDSAPWDSRTVGLLTLCHQSRVIVVHDADYFPTQRLWGQERAPIAGGLTNTKSSTGRWKKETLGFRDYSELFSSWVEVFPLEPSGPTGPPTLVGSNFLDIDGVLNESIAEGIYLRA
jgi:hypothetical protein